MLPSSNILGIISHPIKNKKSNITKNTMIAAKVLGTFFVTNHMVGAFKIRVRTIPRKKRNKILIISYANHKPRITKAAV